MLAPDGTAVERDARPLDLRFDPPVPAPQEETVVPQAAPAPAGHATEAPFSLGVEIKTPREVAGPPRQGATDPLDPPTLADRVEGLVERSAIGLTGTYRF